MIFIFTFFTKIPRYSAWDIGLWSRTVKGYKKYIEKQLPIHVMNRSYQGIIETLVLDLLKPISANLSDRLMTFWVVATQSALLGLVVLRVS